MQKPGRNRKQGGGNRRRLVNWLPGFIPTVLDEKIFKSCMDILEHLGAVYLNIV